MKTKAVFLDRDGTINVEKDYLYEIERFEFLPGVIEGLKRLQEAGYLLIVITNQSGIARGFYTEEDYQSLTAWMKKGLDEKGVTLTDVFYCPHLKDAIVSKYKVDCECRKPRLGMFYSAIDKYGIDLSESVVIGDKSRDLAICRTVQGKECRGYLVYADEEKSEGNICYIKGGVDEAAKHILGNWL